MKTFYLVWVSLARLNPNRINLLALGRGGLQTAQKERYNQRLFDPLPAAVVAVGFGFFGQVQSA